ncbi:hypothetical protein M422DRAFT_56867, partial [Sphaerobolus stellatus SS14]
DPRFVPILFVSGIGGPLDSEVVLKHALQPALPVVARKELDAYMEKQSENESITPKKSGRGNITYYVGMLFLHRRYHYVGLIRGWDARCEASTEWINQMLVDKLNRGRHQPFYHSLTSDGYVRYVAEENIQPFSRPGLDEIQRLINANEEIGRWFDGVEVLPSGKVRFKLSPESQWIHPEDESFGKEVLTDGIFND